MKTLIFTSAFALLLAAGVAPQAQAGDRGLSPQATVLDVSSYGNALMQQRMTKKQMMKKQKMMKSKKMMRKKKMMNNM